MNKSDSAKKDSAKKRETWTFQPSKEVLELVKQLKMSPSDRGARSRLINDAIRFAAAKHGANERAAIFRQLASELSERAEKEAGLRPTPYALRPTPSASATDALASSGLDVHDAALEAADLAAAQSLAKPEAASPIAPTAMPSGDAHPRKGGRR